MEYFILNDHSLPFEQEENIDQALKLFFDIYKKATKVNFKTIRITNSLDSGWYSIPIGCNTYIRTWIEQQDQEYKGRIKALIASTQSPILSIEEIEVERAQLSDFFYQQISVPSLGACYLLNQLALSFYSNPKWDSPSFLIDHHELKNGDSEIEHSLKNVNNVTTVAHWEHHYSLIEQVKIQNLQQSKTFLNDFETLFEHIQLVTTVKKKLIKGEFSPVFHQRIWDSITSLNDYIIDCLDKNIPPNYTDLIDFTQLNISDESDSVKNNDKLSRHRLFRYNGESYFFGYHIKNFPSSQRMHFLILENKIVIGYVGKHLPT
ncbi:hypothetical protein [Aureispira anguillae]|uniref:Uncharacterized protein n=1 Tax=Aureispira anguillae TaxID=2864201 RepID=A0A915VKG6_9BACT|nr:hypothetical protein [Aureispira anguillae]BDS09696.1 hypothetical protein AsAng_0004000 [Aureispira anguillae]